MAIRDGVTASAYRRPMGYQQIGSVALAAGPVSLTVPTLPNSGLVAGYAVIQCETNLSSVRWRDDGVAPDANTGERLLTGQELDYSGDLYMIQFIRSAGDPILNISYYA